MAYRDFQHFLEVLEKQGELRRISYPLDPVLEITEVADRVMKSGGPALLIEKPKGYDIPVAINTFGSRRRMSMALGVQDIEEIAREIESLLKPEIPERFVEKIGMLPKLLRLADMPPKKRGGDGLCQQVVLTGDAVDIEQLPHLKCWPEDGGRYITLPLVFTHDPNTGKRNVGMYRIQVLSRNTVAMHWQLHKVGAEHYRVAEEKQQPIQVAVVLGGDPALTYSATAPLPPGIDEMMFAGFLRRQPVELVKCKTIDVWVPADAETVLEGYINPGERVMEGPFGDHTGYYSLADLYPMVHITAVTHRKNPMYPATIVGRPPMEDAWLGKATERIFLPLIKLMVPEIVDMNLPVEACFHNLAIVSIKKRYPGHAFKVMNALWGLGQLMFTKIIIVVDDDVNVQDMGEVIWRFTNNIDPERDMLITRGPIDVLDHASRVLGYGSKIGFDATRKWPSEGFNREWPEVITMSPEVKQRIDQIWEQLGLG
ncbi:MAG: menaquinone biosynthesis decarboxylase [Armatimonadota bacterium]